MNISKHFQRVSPPGLGPLCRVCNVLRWMLLTFLVVEIGFFALSWLIPMPLDFGPLRIAVTPDGMTAEAVRRLPRLAWIFGILIGLPGLIMLTYAVRWLGLTLRQFHQGEIFAVRTIGHLHAFAGATVCAALLFNLETPMRAIAFNLAAGTREHPVSFNVTSNELLLILVCGLFYLIVGVMQEGRRLAEENEGFI
jgi:hypothetical protein